MSYNSNFGKDRNIDSNMPATTSSSNVGPTTTGTSNVGSSTGSSSYGSGNKFGTSGNVSNTGSNTSGAYTGLSTHTVDSKIRHDHRIIFQLFDKFKSLDRYPSEQKKWANQIIWEVARHSSAEESVLYPEFERVLVNGKVLADRNRHDHLELKKNLSKLEGINIEKKEFDQLLTTIMENLRTHVEFEENEELPMLTKALTLSELENLGSKYDTAKKIAPTRPHPSAPDKGMMGTVAGVLTAPFDKLRDTLKTFPTDDEIQQVVGHQGTQM